MQLPATQGLRLWRKKTIFELEHIMTEKKTQAFYLRPTNVYIRSCTNTYKR